MIKTFLLKDELPFRTGGRFLRQTQEGSGNLGPVGQIGIVGVLLFCSAQESGIFKRSLDFSVLKNWKTWQHSV